MSKKTIIVIIGPSGSGKTSVTRRLVEIGIPELTSHTTRLIRDGECHGKDYYFVSNEEFNETEMIETAPYSNYSYGLSKKELESKLHLYDTVFIIMNREGYESIIEKYGKQHNVICIYFYCSAETCYEHMKNRGDNENSILQRIKNIHETGELNNFDIANYVIMSGKHSIEECKDMIEFYVKMEENK